MQLTPTGETITTIHAQQLDCFAIGPFTIAESQAVNSLRIFSGLTNHKNADAFCGYDTGHVQYIGCSFKDAGLGTMSLVCKFGAANGEPVIGFDTADFSSFLNLEDLSRN